MWPFARPVGQVESWSRPTLRQPWRESGPRWRLDDLGVREGVPNAVREVGARSPAKSTSAIVRSHALHRSSAKAGRFSDSVGRLIRAKQTPSDAEGWLVRVDAKTGRVLGRIRCASSFNLIVRKWLAVRRHRRRHRSRLQIGQMTPADPDCVRRARAQVQAQVQRRG